MYGSDDGNINKKILGLPLGFTEQTDPNRRIYNKYTQDAVMIGLIPGRPKFRPASLRTAKYEALLSILEKSASDEDKTGWSGEIDLNEKPTFVDYFHRDDNIYGDEAKSKLGEKYNTVPDPDKQAAPDLYERDLRFYSFDPAVNEFQKVVNVLLNEVGGKMSGISFGHRNISKYLDMSQTHTYGINFCAEASSTVSESFSSELSESAIVGLTRKVSGAAKEAAFLLGISDRTAGSADSRAKIEQQARNLGAEGGLSGMLSNLSSSIVGGFDDSNRVGALLNGENLLFPKIWQNTTFDKSYNISFRFLSPYGDVDSIFEYVYVPFLALCAMSGPIQVATDSYKSPFLVRVNCPGTMECDMGMITNISWVRGTSQNLYSVQGIPLGIDVTVSVTDMYPAMSIASNHALLRQNIGLSAFLDNMCGLSNMKANIIPNINANIASKMATAYGYSDAIEVGFKDWFDKINFFTR